jgi:hypothetical protein
MTNEDRLIAWHAALAVDGVEVVALTWETPANADEGDVWVEGDVDPIDGHPYTTVIRVDGVTAAITMRRDSATYLMVTVDNVRSDRFVVTTVERSRLDGALALYDRPITEIIEEIVRRVRSSLTPTLG